jgi:hypothetical protein
MKCENWELGRAEGTQTRQKDIEKKDKDQQIETTKR